MRTAAIAPTAETGSFCHHTLSEIKDEGQRLAKNLSMLIFEYVFDNAAPKRAPANAANWPHWQLEKGFVGHRPLVPQLLSFTFFYSDAIPERYGEVLPPRGPR